MTFEESVYVPYKKEVKGPLLSISWVTGGMSGGSCWGHQPEQIDSEPEPKFEVLDKVLQIVCPTISYLSYRKIESDLIKEGSNGDSGYYGNYTNYAIKYLLLKDLYDFLVNEKMI